MSDFQKQHDGHRCTVAHLVASANIYPGAALFFKQIVEKLTDCYENQFSDATGCPSTKTCCYILKEL